SAAHALANDMGWDAIEVNASDRRRADEIERYVGRASANTTLGGTAGRQLIIVDEADSFSGSADRGGARSLSDLVDDAGQPIVLIVNDEYDMPRSLRRKVETIEFRDISKRSIVPVLRDICRREDIDFDEEALEMIAELDKGDLRSAIKDLQAVVESGGSIDIDDVDAGERDQTNDIFTFLDAVLKEQSAEEALQTAYGTDETPDDLIRWVEDKVPLIYDGDELADAYEFLAASDRWLGRVWATQEYSYWRYATDNLAAGVAAVRREARGGWTRYGGAPYRSSKDATRDYVARKIAEGNGVSMATARREMFPFLSALTHH
ncbi:MAG: replication factor C large subunit, partial [Halobacteriaceae archaeon]